MPFVYVMPTAILQENFTTSATPNTQIDHQFIKPGTRNIAVISLLVGGKGAGLTSLTGIAYRLKKWTTTSASGGTAMTPNPIDPGSQASKATAGWTTNASVTPGTGGPQYMGTVLSSGSGPGGWVTENPDAAPTLEGSANQSMDLWSSSGIASMNFEATTKFQE